MFTSYMHKNSQFGKKALFDAAENNKFRLLWEKFLNSHQDLMGILDQVPYFACCKPVDVRGNGWNIPLVSKHGPITHQAGIMFNVCLIHRLESMKKSKIKQNLIESEIKKDALKLIDKLVYERLDGKLWSGSGDSRAAKEIKKFKNHEVQIPKIADESWETLLAQLFWGQNVEPAEGNEKTFRTDGPNPKTISQPYCVVRNRKFQQRETNPREKFLTIITYIERKPQKGGEYRC